MTRPRSPLPDEEDDLYSYFNKSVSAVQDHADHFEQEYARPALRAVQEFFDEHAITATFIVILSFLSFIPVASFLGLSLFAVASITILAVASAIIISAGIVLTLLTILVLTLLAALAASAVLTLSGISLYSFASLLNEVRTNGRTGISKWIGRMSDLLFGNLPTQFSTPSSDRQDAWIDEELEDVEVKVEPVVKDEDDDTPLFGYEQDPSTSELRPRILG
ncbi:hypothetical protein FPV67DRAFT_1672690 [Lyophyllum atratum]|nr:hypothetical protein FPV67DRAFT_1672690 [Lyophyllum atratum]